MSYYLKVILTTAVITYLIRMLPLSVFKKRGTSRWLKSFMFYIPYAVLGAMTFPAILYSTNSPFSAAVGMVGAVVLAYFDKGLMLTALGASGLVFLVELFVK